METKDIMSKFDELYGIMASSTNVKYMHVFGNSSNRTFMELK